MKIAIVGCGAVGLYYGARLERSGQEVHFLMRSDYASARAAGISVVASDGDFVVSPARAHRDPVSIGICDLVIVSLKTTSNDALPALLGPLVGDRTALLTLQNGLGNDELLAMLFPWNSILSGLCFVCLNRVAPAKVESFLLGSVSIGAFSPAATGLAQEVVAMFAKSGVETRFAADLRLTQWKKLVWNVPFNGLAIAAGGVATDVIIGRDELMELTRALMQEVLDGAAALGLTIEPSYIDFQIDRTRKMGAYKPSSMIDFLDGRPVEVECIWGEPLRRAQGAGAKLPRLEMLYALLKQLCQS